MCRVYLIVISLFLFAGCRQSNEPMKQAKIDSNSDNRFEVVYAAWKLKEKEFRHYSKTTRLKQQPEYKNFLLLGSECVPKLREKLLADDGFDFVLCDVIIELEGWSLDEFSMGDHGKRARQVLKKLEDGPFVP